MTGGLVLVTAPTEEPLTLQEGKDHLRVSIVTDDALITAYLKATRLDAEKFTSRAFVTQTWDWFLDSFPDSDGILHVPKPPLQSITSIKYLDSDGVQQTLAATKYVVDTKRVQGRIQPAVDDEWPDTRDTLNAVEIRFVAGYGLGVAVPEGIKQGMRLILGHLHENRELSAPIAINRIPMDAEAWLWPYVLAEV